MTTWSNRITFEVSSADPDSDTPVWVDLSEYLLTRDDPLDLRIGRQNDLDQSEPSVLSLKLNNADDRFTYGNTSSPYAAWWGPGRKCRYRETIGTTVLDLFTGYLQMPTESVAYEALDYMWVNVTATDRLGRLASSEPFVSTVGACVSGIADLHTYFPLNELDGPVAASAGPTSQGNLHRDDGWFTGTTAAARSSPDRLQFGMGAALPGDDVVGVLFSPEVPAPTETGAHAWLEAVLPTPIVISTGQFLTLSAWITPGVTATVQNQFPIYLTGPTFGVEHAGIDIIPSGGGYAWRADFFDASWGTLFTGSTTGMDAPAFVTAVFQLGATQRLWVNGVETTSSFGGSPPASITFTELLVGFGTFGSISHVQISLGTTEPSLTDHLAQYQVGLFGFERQSTGERIRTIAKYLDIDDTELDIDDGTTVMQAASLADKTPLAAMREAENTEQGLLYMDGSGVLHFKDRRSLYNI